MNILVTGGAGFIGSNFCHLLRSPTFEDANIVRKLIVLDKLTYAGRKQNIASLTDVQLIEGDILDQALVLKTLKEFEITHIFHFAAESHVDNSINGPAPFIQTNIVGTFSMLEATREYCKTNQFAKFIHISTDEVFGDLGETGCFDEGTPYAPHSPYSASKAASDHLASAWFHTYKIPIIITNCSNNYGPRQFPEKLIPVVIHKAISGSAIPVYGQGQNIRDWIYVDDHNYGVWLAAKNGKLGESYCLGARQEVKNIDLVQKICAILDEIKPKSIGKYADQIQFVEDRLGHDFRYAINPTKAEQELHFSCKMRTIEEGLKQTISWYLSELR